MAVFPVVLDANVLYGVFSTDILVTLAGRRMYRAHWTEMIIDEAERNIISARPDLDANAVSRRFDAMKIAMPEAMLEAPPADLIAAMENDEGDRHVLAGRGLARNRRDGATSQEPATHNRRGVRSPRPLHPNRSR